MSIEQIKPSDLTIHEVRRALAAEARARADEGERCVLSWETAPQQVIWRSRGRRLGLTYDEWRPWQPAKELVEEELHRLLSAQVLEPDGDGFKFHSPGRGHGRLRLGPEGPAWLAEFAPPEISAS